MNRDARGEEDGFLLSGWLIKTAATLAVVGFLGYDGVSLVTTDLGLADRADKYASAAADTYSAGSRDPQIVQKAFDVVYAAAKAHGDTVPTTSFHIAPDGTVTLTAKHDAPSLWMRSIGPLKQYTHVSATGHGAGPS